MTSASASGLRPVSSDYAYRRRSPGPGKAEGESMLGVVSDESESDESGSDQDYDDDCDEDEEWYDQRHDVAATTNVAATRAMQESNHFSVQRWLSETPPGEEETIQTPHRSTLQRNADFRLTEAALGDEGVHSSMRKIQVKSIGKARQPLMIDGELARV